MEAIAIRDDGRKLLGVGGSDEVDLGEFAERGEVLGERGVLERRDVAAVVGHVAKKGSFSICIDQV